MEDRGIEFRFPAGTTASYLLSVASRPALVPTQPPTQWVSGAISPGGKAAGA
jgi:hypothetical protein